jgi:predicted metalloprotease with PDZ domain
MFEYFLSFLPKEAIINVKIVITAHKGSTLNLHLPAWRPGRYQLQNFAKNIRNFSAYDAKGNILPYKKQNRNQWTVENPQTENKITVSYEYLAHELNAGGSHISPNLIYFNPVNISMYLPDQMDLPFKVHIVTDNKNTELASGLLFKKNKLGFTGSPTSMRQWFDSPIMISENLIHLTFKSRKTPFHFWVAGSLGFSAEKLISDLKKIANTQIDLFGSFPEKDYHFMLIVPQDAYYHGVEHANSTLLVLGQHTVLHESYYQDLLGLASHELFHAWNIAKIRPKELLPYDFGREQYFETCFVAEGFTTYYGDKILKDAAVISADAYHFELETTLRRHFENADAASQSLLESSVDLWVDGYEKAIPHKRVSVYDKGAIAAFILDTLIKTKSQDSRSLNNVMKKLWQEFGNLESGYTYLEIKAICEDIYGDKLDAFFDHVIASNVSIWNITQVALASIGKCMIKTNEGQVSLENLKS